MRTRRRSSRVLVAALAAAVLAAALATAVQGSRGSRSASGHAVASPKTADLVWISDSVGWGVASFYASQIRHDLGIKVRVHDQWEGGLPAKVILKRLRTPGHPWIRLIRNAEIIFVSGNPFGLEIRKGGDCATTGCRPPGIIGPQAWTKYITTLKAIYGRIFEIRNGKPVILRTANWYVPIIAQAPNEPTFPCVSWRSCGITDICTQKWQWFSWAIAKAAASYHVPVADVYKAFNGKSHLEDPVAKGYIGPDGIHQSNKGRALFAKTLAALGYRQVRPPK